MRVSVALRTAQIPVLGERLAYPILMVLVHSAAPWLIFPCSMSLFFRTLCFLLADDENGVTVVVQLGAARTPIIHEVIPNVTAYNFWCPLHVLVTFRAITLILSTGEQICKTATFCADEYFLCVG